jgi:hypothetical protein
MRKSNALLFVMLFVIATVCFATKAVSQAGNSSDATQTGATSLRPELLEDSKALAAVLNECKKHSSTTVAHAAGDIQKRLGKEMMPRDTDDITAMLHIADECTAYLSSPDLVSYMEMPAAQAARREANNTLQRLNELSRTSAVNDLQSLEALTREHLQSPYSQQSSSPEPNRAQSGAAPFHQFQANTQAAASVTVPGQVSNDQLQEVYKALDNEKPRATADLLSQAAPLSDALRTLQHNASAFPITANHPSIQAIGTLQRRLGKTLKPQRPEDILEMLNVLQGAMRTFYKFAPDGCCESLYSLAGAVRQEESFQGVLTNVEQQIAAVEKSLDEKDFAKANGEFASLASSPSADQLGPLKQYLEMTRPLRNDLQSLSALSSARNSRSGSLDTRIHYIAQNESTLATSVDAPITASYLHKWLDEDKDSVKSKLKSLPPFGTTVRPFVNKRVLATSSVEQFSEQYDSANSDLEQLKRDLEAVHELVEITSDQAAMQSIRSWYGSEEADSLTAKVAGVEAAKENETKLVVYVGLVTGAREREEAAKNERIAKIQQQREQEEARKQALITERNNLAGTIWNEVIMITMLDEKFRLTEVMGYSIEAQKQRTELNSLLRRDSSMLTPSLWAEVGRAYQQMLPGLTVWQATHSQSIIEELRSSAR